MDFMVVGLLTQKAQKSQKVHVWTQKKRGAVAPLTKGFCPV